MRDMTPFRGNELNPMNMFRDFFGRDLMDGFFGDNMFSMKSAGGFCADIKESEKEYVVEAELPGYKKEDIQINLVDDRLTISAKKSEEINEERDNYIRRERRVGQASRSFIVSGIKNKEVTAEYKDGILNITLPKEKESEPRNTRIDIQ